MSTAIRNTRTCARGSDQHSETSTSSSFEHTENMPPPPFDSSRNVPILQGGELKTIWPTQSLDTIHSLSCRKTPPQRCFKLLAGNASFNSDSNRTSRISESVRDAFIPPRHNFANKKKEQMDEDKEKDTLTPSGIIFELGQHDIVCGRGAPSHLQEGNTMFRELVEEYQAAYLCSKRADKPKIAMQVMEEVRARQGRFVRRVKTATNGRCFGWEELDEKRSYEKVCQTLREGAPEIRRKMLSCSIIREESTTKRNNQAPPERQLLMFQDGSYSCRYDFYQ